MPPSLRGRLVTFKTRPTPCQSAAVCDAHPELCHPDTRLPYFWPSHDCVSFLVSLRLWRGQRSTLVVRLPALQLPW